MTPVNEAPAQPQIVTSVDVAVAVLTEKVTQVIGDHERRISALENRNDNGSGRLAAVFAPIIATIALVMMVADKIKWN
jgi:hypothetical protein